MPRYFYEVNATFRDASTAHDWLAWMHDHHIADVIAAGALSGRVIQNDSNAASPQLSLSAQYEFADRASFDAYLRDHAPRLRTEGLQKFPPDVVAYSRRSGDIVA